MNTVTNGLDKRPESFSTTLGSSDVVFRYRAELSLYLGVKSLVLKPCSSSWYTFLVLSGAISRYLLVQFPGLCWYLSGAVSRYMLVTSGAISCLISWCFLVQFSCTYLVQFPGTFLVQFPVRSGYNFPVAFWWNLLVLSGAISRYLSSTNPW